MSGWLFFGPANGKEIQITGGEIGSWNDGGEMGDINLDVKTGDEENK